MSKDYSALDRLFHRVVLGNPFLSEALGDLDSALSRTSTVDPNHPVYVTGLARAGTTMLMRVLHATGNFASLTYADMPMVMAPLLWARLSGRFAKERVTSERAHGDGVMVDFDAPEALEEVFWRIHCGEDYILSDALVPHEPDTEAIEAYCDYVSRICQRYGKSRYLAKNNNLMLRLGSLRDALPEATFLLVVRNPVAQSQSLLSQHERFANSDDFTRSYMTWLVHHEFGPATKPYKLPGHPMANGDLLDLNNWLTLWVACYGWLLEVARKRPNAFQVVVYEQLCSNAAVLQRIADVCGVDKLPPFAFRPVQETPVPENVDAALLDRANDIYRALNALSRSWLSRPSS